MRALLAISILLVAASPAVAQVTDADVAKAWKAKALIHISDAEECVNTKAAEYGAISTDPVETVADGVLGVCRALIRKAIKVSATAHNIAVSDAEDVLNRLMRQNAIGIVLEARSQRAQARAVTPPRPRERGF